MRATRYRRRPAFLNPRAWRLSLSSRPLNGPGQARSRPGLFVSFALQARAINFAPTIAAPYRSKTVGGEANEIGDRQCLSVS